MLEKTFHLGAHQLTPKILKSLAFQEKPNFLISETTWKLCEKKHQDLVSFLLQIK